MAQKKGATAPSGQRNEDQGAGSSLIICRNKWVRTCCRPVFRVSTLICLPSNGHL